MQRWNPCENVLNVNNVGNLGLKWIYATLDRVQSSPAVANGVVYFGSEDHKVYALKASTGAKLWSYTTGDVVESSPAVANGVVYVGSFDGNVYALNASTGSKLWSYATGASVYSSPAVANGVVYVSAEDGTVYALEASTGSKLWSYTTGGGVFRYLPRRGEWSSLCRLRRCQRVRTQRQQRYSAVEPRYRRPGVFLPPQSQMEWFMLARMTATCTP